MVRVRTVFKLFAPILLSGSLYSPTILAAPASVDALTPYPNAHLDDEFNGAVTSYPILSSSVKKVNGVVMADSQQWFDGHLERRLYLLPSGSSSDQAFRFYTNQFKELGVTELFSCERFNCGRSNFWANDVFDIARLYGLDKEQAYFVGKQAGAQQDAYYLTYTVKRGNRREYALVDVFTFNKSKTAAQSINEHVIEMNSLPQTLKAFEQSSLAGRVSELDRTRSWMITIQDEAATTTREFDVRHQTMNQVISALTDYLIKQGFESDKFRIQALMSGTGKTSISFSELND